MAKIKEEVLEQIVLETKEDTSEQVIITQLEQEQLEQVEEEEVVVSSFQIKSTVFCLEDMLLDFKSIVEPSENILVCIQHVECLQKLLQKEINKIEVVDAEIIE